MLLESLSEFVSGFTLVSVAVSHWIEIFIKNNQKSIYKRTLFSFSYLTLIQSSQVPTDPLWKGCASVKYHIYSYLLAEFFAQYCLSLSHTYIEYNITSSAIPS